MGTHQRGQPAQKRRKSWWHFRVAENTSVIGDETHPWRLDLQAIVYNTFNRPYTFRTHQHPDHELIYVQRGEYRAEVNGHPIQVPDHAFLLLTPGDWHCDEGKPGTEYFAFRFAVHTYSPNGRSSTISVFQPQIEAEHHLYHCPESWIRMLDETLEHERKLPDPYSRPLLEAIFKQIFYTLLRLTPPEHLSDDMRRLTTGKSSFPTRLKQIFEASLTSPLTVKELAARLHMSESSLAHRCRDELGIGVQKAYSRFRIERAAEFVTSTQMSIREISDYFGFKNPYHFSRLFKRWMGVSPQHYRKRKNSTQFTRDSQDRDS
ncbi:MAG: AraC family transcriptional regulator [Lentisphaerae bacterium]|nr:MAG: AraC family transcriptional regulator [Lentisphaerota bacterium]